MRIEQRCWSPTDGWAGGLALSHNARCALVLLLGPRSLLETSDAVQQARCACPNAEVVGCSTAGEIAGTHVHDGALIFTAVEFEHSHVRAVETILKESAGSFAAGQTLAKSLVTTELVHVLVLSNGLQVNGSELVKGLTQELPTHVAATGGLAGDGSQFGQTLVHLNNTNRSDRIVAIGMYGNRLRVGYGSRGGWDPFGPERIVTRSIGNVLYELDGESALGLYERYLGEYADGLPASALRFPLSIRPDLNSTGVVRTILGIDQKQKSMTFAGDVGQGDYARLMRADVNHIIDGASGAAQVAVAKLECRPVELALLISCVGRKLVLKQRVEEEVEAVRDVVGAGATFAGFYSYGEICPFGAGDLSTLHNQTMTVTTFSEAA